MSSVSSLVATGQAGVVFPRSAGTLDSTFAIKGAGVAFDLGTVRYVGAASTTMFSFHNGGGGAECDGDDHDAAGATCVDDGDNEDNQCEGDQEEGDQEDGTANDGADDGTNEVADAPDEGEAVAEHNFPADGCAGGNDNGGDSDQPGSH